VGPRSADDDRIVRGSQWEDTEWISAVVVQSASAGSGRNRPISIIGAGFGAGQLAPSGQCSVAYRRNSKSAHVARSEWYASRKPQAKSVDQPLRHYAARAGGIEGEIEAANANAPMEISPISSGLFKMQERFSNAPDAQAGQLVAELPTQSQSWQRYADFNGMCCSMGEVIDIPPVLGCAEWLLSEKRTPHIGRYLAK